MLSLLTVVVDRLGDAYCQLVKQSDEADVVQAIPEDNQVHTLTVYPPCAQVVRCTQYAHLMYLAHDEKRKQPKT